MGALPIPVPRSPYTTMGGGVPFGSVGSVGGGLASSYGGHVGQCDTYGSQARGRCLHPTPRASTSNHIMAARKIHHGPVQDTADGASPTDPESAYTAAPCVTPLPGLVWPHAQNDDVTVDDDDKATSRGVGDAMSAVAGSRGQRQRCSFPVYYL
ncbi:hypothetical protein EDB85DRAFT_1996861 [Lactarius pseudohatsudake]|nr:hypothetical protein EDB85DRAFT_1996861 [Lactarius pseudohatsudake]